MTVNLPKYFIPEVVATFIYCFFTQSWQPEFGFLGPFMTGLSVYLIIVVNHTMAIVHGEGFEGWFNEKIAWPNS